MHGTCQHTRCQAEAEHSKPEHLLQAWWQHTRQSALESMQYVAAHISSRAPAIVNGRSLCSATWCSSLRGHQTSRPFHRDPLPIGIEGRCQARQGQPEATTMLVRYHTCLLSQLLRLYLGRFHSFRPAVPPARSSASSASGHHWQFQVSPPSCAMPITISGSLCTDAAAAWEPC